MASRPSGPLSLLILLKKYFWAAIAVVAALVSLELAFSFFETSYRQSVWKSVTILLRNDLELANSYLMSRALRDMEMANWIHCAVLKELKPTERIFYDSTHRSGCQKDEGYQEGIITSINEVPWYLGFKPKLDIWLVISRWLSRIVVTILIVIIYIYLQRKNDLQELRALKAERDRQWLIDLASQTRHDVASPISALRVIAASDQIPEKLRPLLRSAVHRTAEIFADLQKAKQPTQVGGSIEYFNVTANVIKVVEEKQKTQNIPIKTEGFSHSIFAFGRAIDFSRVISNLLNNAIEAFDNWAEARTPEISVLGYANDPFYTIEIKDNGKGMAPTTLQQLGEKGFTFGKTHGSGLGVYHAKKTITSWGGRIHFSSKLGEGSCVKIELPRASAHSEVSDTV